MRCKCCDSANTRFILGDWYCPECSSSIHQAIKEDKEREDWYEKDIEKIATRERGDA